MCSSTLLTCSKAEGLRNTCLAAKPPQLGEDSEAEASMGSGDALSQTSDLEAGTLRHSELEMTSSGCGGPTAEAGQAHPGTARVL